MILDVPCILANEATATVGLQMLRICFPFQTRQADELARPHTEGVPYTSWHVRGETFQMVVGGLGLLLALIGVYIGFQIGKRKK